MDRVNLDHEATFGLDSDRVGQLFRRIFRRVYPGPIVPLEIVSLIGRPPPAGDGSRWKKGGKNTISPLLGKVVCGFQLLINALVIGAVPVIFPTLPFPEQSKVM
ncbi:hypothetical protein [Rhizobium tropici]|uniref:hypothetical protein n=1 Tax=Rhizobium tropici TaxID=398 RepID=UPI0011BE5D74|nr:hypothetical protein [Rhizobium tropici]